MSRSLLIDLQYLWSLLFKPILSDFSQICCISFHYLTGRLLFPFRAPWHKGRLQIQPFSWVSTLTRCCRFPQPEGEPGSCRQETCLPWPLELATSQVRTFQQGTHSVTQFSAKPHPSAVLLEHLLPDKFFFTWLNHLTVFGKIFLFSPVVSRKMRNISLLIYSLATQLCNRHFLSFFLCKVCVCLFFFMLSI